MRIRLIAFSMLILIFMSGSYLPGQVLAKPIQRAYLLQSRIYLRMNS